MICDALNKYNDIEKTKDQLITCNIGSIEQCDDWLKMYYWFHDEMKKIVINDYKKHKTAKLLFWGEWQTSNASKCQQLSKLSFGICLRTYDNDIDLINSKFGRLDNKADNYLSQYLYASALNYFIEQNFIDKQGTFENSTVDYTILTNYPFEVEFNINLIDDTFYRKITEYIIEPHVYKMPIGEMLLNLKEQIIFYKTSITEFDIAAKDFKKQVLTLNKK